MPKTHKNLFSEVVEFDNLHSAYLRARISKRFRPEVLKFGENLEENLIQIQNELIWEQYRPTKYRQFYVYDPKKRLISAPAFRDRVIHQALVKVIEPFFESKFIFDSYACRKTKGNHAAMERVYQFSKIYRQNHGEYYVLKADVLKYFFSIDRTVLLSMLRKTIRDAKLLNLIANIVNTDNSNIGLPIGALTSQLFANIYLNELDHFVKEELRMKHYVRYMDDFVILHPDKEALKSALSEINIFLNEKLRIQLNNKTQIFLFKRGVDFCGYRIWPTHILPRKRVLKKFRNSFKQLKARNMSLREVRPYAMNFLGYAKHCNSYKSIKSILNLLF